MTTANKITIFRVLMIPVFLVLAYSGRMIWAFVGFVLASLSDMLDGYVARHYNQITNFGKFMDPLADKVLVMAAMCFFVESGGRVIAAAWSGKIKTTATMICLCLMLLFPAPGPGDSAPDLLAILSTWVILITTVYSGVEYFYKNRDVFRNVK